MRYVRSVDRAFDLIAAIAAASKPMTLQELSKRIRAPKSTTLNILRTLHQKKALTLDTANKTYDLGSNIASLSRSASGTADLIRRSSILMTSLVHSTGETVMLIADGKDEATIIELIKSPNVIQYNATVGSRRPLYCTSAGKVMLSLRSSEELEAYLKRTRLQKFATNTIIKRDRLIDEIKVARQRGFALGNSEFAEDLLGISAPVFWGAGGKLAAAICVAGPTYRMKAKLTNVQESITRTASLLSIELGPQ